MTTNQKSVGLAAGVIVSTLVFIGLLTHANQPTVQAPGAQQDPQWISEGDPSPIHGRIAGSKRQLHAHDAAKVESASEGARGKMGPEEGRQRYALMLNQRMSQRQKVQVTVEDAGNTTLKMVWPAEGTGMGQIESLKRAKPFFAELKSRGYAKLSCWIGNKAVWDIDL